MNNEKINIIIVDSGVDIHHQRFQGVSVIGFTYQNGTLTEGVGDEYGHGTAVFGILKQFEGFHKQFEGRL